MIALNLFILKKKDKINKRRKKGDGKTLKIKKSKKLQKLEILISSLVDKTFFRLTFFLLRIFYNSFYR